MNHLKLSQAIDGYLLDAAARRLAAGTLADYRNAFGKLTAYAGDPVFAEIGPDVVRGFLASLSEPRSPGGAANRPAKALSNKSVLNIHTALSALWTWAVGEGITQRHVLHEVRRPKPEQRAIEPLSLEDVRGLLRAAERSARYRRAGKRECDHGRATAIRDKAIILLLVDTGVRASELCGLDMRHVDLRNRHITVMGKGNKGRRLPFSAGTGKALWRYIQASRAEATAGEALFLGLAGDRLTRDALLKVLQWLGQRAGVEGVHPHRFRHTFAVQYLRNGGNTLALQEALGHETLEMVRVYARIAQADLDRGHEIASPVANWGL